MIFINPWVYYGPISSPNFDSDDEESKGCLGVEHLGEKLNYYWDFEPIEEDITHWQDVRERAAIAALQGILANTKLVDNLGKPGWNAARAVQHADELIKYLKIE